jgi:hypothetical protein
MNNYKMVVSIQGVIQRLSDNACIPFDPANTDYANFKAQIMANEAQLQDAEGVTMSPDAAKQFVATLP